MALDRAKPILDKPLMTHVFSLSEALSVVSGKVRYVRPSESVRTNIVNTNYKARSWTIDLVHTSALHPQRTSKSGQSSPSKTLPT